MAANHLSAAGVSELPDYLARNRNVSSVLGNSKTSSNGDDGFTGIHNSDCSIKTGFISDSKLLSKEEYAQVIAEQK